ncbi:hypothetical protein OXX80_000582 [Metschnikowia pulcherrima]
MRRIAPRNPRRVACINSTSNHHIHHSVQLLLEMSDSLNLKKRLKDWETEFTSKNGRLPSKADAKADKNVWELHRAYANMKKAKKAGSVPSKSDSKPNKSNLEKAQSSKVTSESLSKSPKTARRSLNGVPESPLSAKSSEKKQRNPFQTNDIISSIDFLLTDDEETEPIVPVQNAELGPTPQANGKVLSIFDLMLSPPESSPSRQSVKGANSLLPATQITEASPFKTPSKAVKRINLSDLTPSRRPHPSGETSPVMSPTRSRKTPSSTTRVKDFTITPQYLGKVNKKFSFSEKDASPQSSPVKTSYLTPTMTRLAEAFQDSPSPLKSQRLLQKKLIDVYNEHKNLVANEEFEAQKLEFEKEFVVEGEAEAETPTEENARDTKRRKKATTQKRTTRRWKIKPRKEGEAPDSFDGKDVHEEMQKLDTADRSDLARYIDDEESEEEESEEEEVVARKTPASTKLHSISNNYQRLKINDPRSKKFKQRMKRR